MPRCLTPTQLRDEALAAAGLRAPNQRQFKLNSEEAHRLLCHPPSALPQIPLMRHNPVEREG